eukprot:jgi/Bigna1/77461/fgenesh1_pg.48_\
MIALLRASIALEVGPLLGGFLDFSIHHTVGVLVHFDFPESLDQYKVRREAATGAATAIVGDGGIGRPPPTNPSSAPKSEAGEEKASTTTRACMEESYSAMARVLVADVSILAASLPCR